MKVSVTIPAKRGYLSFLRGVVSSLEVSDKLKRRGALALVEAVDNAIIHAHGKKNASVIEIEVEQKRSGLSIVVKDEGKGFDIGRIKKPDLSDISGRGIYIIKSLADKVSYKENRLSIFFKERRD